MIRGLQQPHPEAWRAGRTCGYDITRCHCWDDASSDAVDMTWPGGDASGEVAAVVGGGGRRRDVRRDWKYPDKSCACSAPTRSRPRSLTLPRKDGEGLRLRTMRDAETSEGRRGG